MTPAEGASVVAAKALFKVAVTDVYRFIAKQTGRKIKQWNTERKIETLYRRISQVRKVKTIWQVDKTVDLSAFYCDSHIVTDSGRKKIHQLSDFNTSDNLLIQGIAGQGKSIFLRYLCSVELAVGTRIPIFLELRRVSKGHSLRDRIYTALKALGLDVDDELFDALSASGRIVLLLDAFDEVPDALKSEVLTDIEDLASTHDNLRIIVTSRPNNSIQMSRQFCVVNLDNLRGDEYAQVIRKLAAGGSWAKALITHIEKQATHMLDLLCTPLMVTLLVLSYKSYHKLPNKMADFYDSLFQTLLQRHDGTKPGFARERTCALDDGQYRQAFETLCILAKKARQQSYSYAIIHELTKNALSECSLDANPESYVKDIVRITCLILRDGEEHRFIHKTVQEYYTASFIARQPEPWSRAFYKKILSQKAHRDWHQELDFLSEIDVYRYKRYYYLPAILTFMGIAEHDLDGAPRLTQAKLRSILHSVAFQVEYGTGQAMRFAWSARESFLTRDFILACLPALDKVGAMEALPKVRLAPSTKKKSTRKASRRVPAYGYRSVELTRAMDAAGLMRAFTEELKPEYAKLFSRGREIRASLRAREDPDLLDGLI